APRSDRPPRGLWPARLSRALASTGPLTDRSRWPSGWPRASSSCCRAAILGDILRVSVPAPALATRPIRLARQAMGRSARRNATHAARCTTVTGSDAPPVPTAADYRRPAAYTRRVRAAQYGSRGFARASTEGGMVRPRAFPGVRPDRTVVSGPALFL